MPNYSSLKTSSRQDLYGVKILNQKLHQNSKKMSNYILYESILDDDDIIISQNKTAGDLIGDEYLHSELKPDDEFDYMLIVSFDVWGSSSYHFINPDKPGHLRLIQVVLRCREFVHVLVLSAGQDSRVPCYFKQIPDPDE